MKKQTASIIGIVLGIAIIIVGFCVQGISTERHTTTIGSNIKFGADFYTEMYDVTRDVGHAINNAKNTIGDAVEGVCDAIGWLIVAIGLFDIAYFSYKMVSCNDDGARNTHYVASPTTTPRDTTQNNETSQPFPAKSDMPPVVQARSISVETSPSPRKVYAEGEFIPGRSYTNGDEVIFENKKYVCLASGTTVWSPSQHPAQWQEIPD